MKRLVGVFLDIHWMVVDNLADIRSRIIAGSMKERPPVCCSGGRDYGDTRTQHTSRTMMLRSQCESFVIALRRAMGWSMACPARRGYFRTTPGPEATSPASTN